jgi:competence ComEA-like helix-hairpin-helix protein
MLNTQPFAMRHLILVLFILLPSNWTQAAGQTAELLDLNAATVQQLAEQLPGIGPAKAQRIVQWRERNGPFPSIDQLIDVHGIGPKTLERLRPLLRVGDAASARRSTLAAQEYEDQVRLAIQQIVDQANRDAARALVRNSP